MKPLSGLYGSLAVLLVVFVADQITKLWVLHEAALGTGPMAPLPFMNIVLVWNRGISYGLFQTDGAGRWVLVGLTVVGTLALIIWLSRARHTIVRLALGAIIGGALGNLVDRIVYGAVVDFVELHAGGYSWYVFNIADAAIVIGVVLLLIDGFFGKSETAR